MPTLDTVSEAALIAELIRRRPLAIYPTETLFAEIDRRMLRLHPDQGFFAHRWDKLRPLGFDPGEVRVSCIAITTAAHEWNLTPDDILGPRRSHDVALSRHVAMSLCRDKGIASTAVATMFDKEDHGTVLHAQKRIRELRHKVASINAQYLKLSAQVAMALAETDAIRENAVTNPDKRLSVTH